MQAAARRARSSRAAEGVAVRVVPVPKPAPRAAARGEDVLAGLPPAAGHPN
jgi:hypothetical protein